MVNQEQDRHDVRESSGYKDRDAGQDDNCMDVNETAVVECEHWLIAGYENQKSRSTAGKN